MSTSDRSPFAKTIKPGTVRLNTGRRKHDVPVYCRIVWDGVKLSITGTEGPVRGGNAVGGSGQIVMNYINDGGAAITPAPGWTRALIAAFIAIWDRWHLNDMRPGAPDQEDAIRAVFARWRAEGCPEPKPFAGDHYKGACEYLQSIGIYESRHPGPITIHGHGERPAEGYKYGHGHVMDPVPDEVLDALRALPESPDVPAWG